MCVKFEKKKCWGACSLCVHCRWGVTAIYAKILHDPVLQESQKKFWLFKHNFRALDLTWSDYVIVNKSTWVWELHNCQLTLITNFIKLSWKSQKRQYFCTCMALFTCFYFLLWMKSTKCRNIADCNIFALLWITALSWSNIFASKLRMLPFFGFKKKTYAMTKKPKISESRCLQGCKVNTISEMILGSGPLSETECNIFA